MEVKVATSCLHWSSRSTVPRSPLPPSSQTPTSSISSSSKKRSRSEGALVCRYVQRLDRSSLFGTPFSTTKLYRSSSCDEYPKSRAQSLRRACSASLDASSDEEFAKKIQELEPKFEVPTDSNSSRAPVDGESDIVSDSREKLGENRDENCCPISESSLKNNCGDFSFEHSRRPFSRTIDDAVQPPLPEIHLKPPKWLGGDEIIQVNMERKANSVDLPFSLRIIKRKKQWQEGFREAGESTSSSIKKAFSSMVFIIRELHSYTLHMRESLSYEDVQGILFRVQQEMHASFVWLFQRVFSHTPTLMVYVMILLANFTVHSMSSNVAVAESLPPYAVMTESVPVIESQKQSPRKFDSLSIKAFTVSPSSGWKMASIGGNSGDGGKVRPIASGTDGDGGFDNSEHYGTVLADESSQVSSLGREESVSGHVSKEEELNLWDSMVEEASKMRATLRDEALNYEIMQCFVSPVTAEIEPDDYSVYFRTELVYQTALAQDPNNSLLLANFAHFLCLVAHDYDRAEEYFKRAVGVEPQDAEALSKYASFLWTVKKDLWAAEETYLESISADPINSFYAANYAHFLWNTGGEDTCFPLDTTDSNDTCFA